ncbi:MAG: UDP-N-acetylglucosamine 1-carboxyvinyltransferase [Myxococcota bacterium]
MDALLIKGGRPLQGDVVVSGAKNAALPVLCACLLSGERGVVQRVPRLSDVETLLRLFEHMGVSSEWRGEEEEVLVDARTIRVPEAPYELVKTMRASVLVLGPLVARMGRARVSLPGGCAIGARPIDQHLKGLRALGAEVHVEHGYVVARARRLVGTRFVFDLPTVTGTENVMMAATLARGTTVLENAACEPEVEDLAAALNGMGARVSGAGTPRIEIEGVDELHGPDHSIIADRVEAGTFLAAVAVAGGDVRIRGAVPGHLQPVIQKVRETGVRVEAAHDGTLHVHSTGELRSADITTAPHPGFPTDMQAQMMAALTVATGTSRVTETIFENRYMHVQELVRLGADISVDGATAVVRGVKRLTGAPVMATDLRASASLVLAALRADGETLVQRIYHLDRGYHALERKLCGLGARVERLRELRLAA